MSTAPLFVDAPADPALLQAVRDRIRHRGLDGHRGRSVVDPAGHLVGIPGLQPLARVRPVRERPDVVARLAGGSLAAVVASSNPGLDDSLGRAIAQRPVAHYVALALGKRPAPDLCRRAEQEGVGIVVAEDRDPAVPPQRTTADDAGTLNRALDAVSAATVAHQFHYNVPTNFLAWVLGVDVEGETPVEEARRRIKDYSVRQGSAGIRGAELLGLLRRQGGTLTLTPHGRAVRMVLPSVRSWSRLHETVKGDGPRLAEAAPDVASAVRNAIADVPAARFVVSALLDLGGTASLRDLVAHSVEHDPVFGLALFLKPEGVAALTRPDGTVAADEADGPHVAERPTFQFKSLLQHLGVLAPGPIRSRSGGILDLDRTVWALDMGLPATKRLPA